MLFKIKANQRAADAFPRLAVIKITQTGPAADDRVQKIMQGAGPFIKIKPQKERTAQQVAAQRDGPEQNVGGARQVFP